MTIEIIVRLARHDDLAKRQELVTQGFSAHFWDAFWYFFLQELTLECCVMAAAVLFIFGGASVSACLALVPAAASFVMVLVTATHCSIAERHAMGMQREWVGVVAEACGAPLSAGPASPLSFQFQLGPHHPPAVLDFMHVVGTVSLSEHRDLSTTGWLHALAVHSEWRARGIGRALARGAATTGVAYGLHALAASVSLLQPAARATLTRAGWRCRSAVDRPLLCNALTLPLVQLELDLPSGPGRPDRAAGQQEPAQQQGTREQPGTSGQAAARGQAAHRYT